MIHYYYYTLNKEKILKLDLNKWHTNNILNILDAMEQLEDLFSNKLQIDKEKLNIIYSNKIIPNQPEEEYNGNREYKLYLDTYNNWDKLQKRSTQLLYRLNEGEGRAIYLIGVDDNGISIGCNLQDLFKSIQSIIKMSNIIKSEISKITIYHSENGNYISTIRCKKELIN
jgi:hypothetical protein